MLKGKAPATLPCRKGLTSNCMGMGGEPEFEAAVVPSSCVATLRADDAVRLLQAAAVVAARDRREKPERRGMDG